MGQTLSAWRGRVASILRDASSLDVQTGQLDDVCITPALAEYSIDRPYRRVIEAAGTGSAYLALPSGWASGWSRIEQVEHPARQDPPSYLDEQAWQMVRSVADVSVEQLLLDRAPAASEYYRLTFTAPWPMPTSTASDDKVDDVAFVAVTHLAASFGCLHLAAEASRDRAGSLPTNIVGQGRERAQALRDEAKRLREVYESFLGIKTSAGGDGTDASVPVSRRMDYDPGRWTLFHGGRR